MSVQMFARIERQLGVRLPLTSLFHATTIADLGRLVAAADADITEWTVIVPVQTAGDKPPFFGIHAVEGGVLFWRHIVSHLPEDQPFYAIQAVGVDGVRTPLSRIPAMAELYIRQIRKIQRHGPYHLGGYSMGGEIAFEVAQQLVAQGETVDLLVLFDTRNPDRSIRPMARTSAGAAAPDFDAPLPEGERSILKTKLNGHYARWSSLSGAAKISYLGNQVGVHVGYAALTFLAQSFRLAGRRLPDRLLRPYLRSRHREALANYIPTTYPGRVTLFRATQTAASSPDDSPMGWGPLAAGGLAVHHFDASHEIVSPQYAKQVAERLDACLTEARAPTLPPCGSGRVSR
jgi:thioesterase domain-containing protein